MIYDILPVNNYIGNNSSTTFDFDFFIENKNQLKVTFFDENSISHELVCDVDYSINELKNPNGSFITFPIPQSSYKILSDKEKISLELFLPFEQLTQYTNSSLLNFSTLESSFDYLTRLIQILKRKISLCISVKECSNYTPEELYQSINDSCISAKNSAQIAQNESMLSKNYSNLVLSANKEINEFKDILIESGMFKFNLFDTKISDHILTGSEAKGWALQGTYVDKAIYPDFYNRCLEQKNAGVESQVTLGELTLTMFVNENGHQFYNIADKPSIDAFYDTYGIADFYGIDTENERIFLPRNKYFHQLTDNPTKVNEMVEAGLPNITAYSPQVMYNKTIDGAFFQDEAKDTSTLTSGVGDSSRGGTLQFDASLSNSIYGNSHTVQPPSSLKLLYYCVGNTVVNEANIDAGGLVAQIEQKANVALDNVMPSQDFVEKTISWGMPDYSSAISVSSLPYTAPADGVFVCQVNIAGSGNNVCQIYVDDNPATAFGTRNQGIWTHTAHVLVPKNSVISNVGGNLSGLQFFPLKGAN